MSLHSNEAALPEPYFAGWDPLYTEWLNRADSLLRHGDWKAAFALQYPYFVAQYAPWARVQKPLAGMRLGVVSTAGFYLREGMQPFDAANPEGDTTWRQLPADVTAAELAIAHEHYPHGSAAADWNCVLPLDHLRELQREQTIGDLGPIISTSGYATDLASIAAVTGPAIAAVMRQAECDAVLTVPV